MHKPTSVAKYLKNLSISKVEEKKLKEVSELLQKSSIIITGGKGRSGFAAQIGARMLKTSRTNAFFYSDVGLPLDKDLAKNKTTAILISSSGTTEEMIRLAEELKELGAKIVCFTSYINSPLAKLSDINMYLPQRAQSEKGTYFERQVVTTEEPTMGDLPEERSLFLQYLLAKDIRGLKLLPAKEIEDFRKWMMENIDDIVELKNWLKIYWNSGILIVSRGTSNSVSGMIANRASHYHMNCRLATSPTSAPLDHHELALIVSGSADKAYASLVQKIREKMRTKLGKKEVSPAVVAITGKGAKWVRECDANLVLGGADPDGRMLHTEKSPQSFYFRAPIVLNMILRSIATEKGLTKKFAELRHINL
ncbi:MAG: SIS domain-containing protein [Candidatus Altiarchaeota archaeon]|nr:SIS domain-containing protein [Candidatus Altiarchaeota archaeon]